MQNLFDYLVHHNRLGLQGAALILELERLDQVFRSEGGNHALKVHENVGFYEHTAPDLPVLLQGA